jgi:hypothetical protein
VTIQPLNHVLQRMESNSSQDEVKEYTSVVIDKNDVGLDYLRRSLNDNGLQTAEKLRIQLSEGSIKFDHHQHVFMWDATTKGINGRVGLQKPGPSVLVKIRWKAFRESGSFGLFNFFSKPSLVGDNMGPLGGKSTNGAWAYKGNIPRKYVFIEGMDKANQPGFESWRKGDGWPDGHAALAAKRYDYEEIL